MGSAQRIRERRRQALALARTFGKMSSMEETSRGPFPWIDDHLVEPEVTRDEIIGGRRVVAQPSKPPHARQRFVLDHVLQAHLAAEYVGATDLLTRHDVNADFATDSCVCKDGVDPAAGTRYLEEIAFEVVSEQKERDASEKAVQMHRRGVRRIFAIFLKSQRVCEWAAESQSWLPLDRDSEIEDPCLVTPLSVAALLDRAAAVIAVVKGLAAQGNPELQRREAAAKVEGKAEGRVEGNAEAILEVLKARGLAVSVAQRQEILLCRDLDCLGRWLRRAAVSSSTAEVMSEP
jgi:hypothetical protein